MGQPYTLHLFAKTKISSTVISCAVFFCFYTSATISAQTPCDEPGEEPGYCCNAACAMAVCEIMPSCCQDVWDAECAALTLELSACCGCVTNPDISGCPPCEISFVSPSVQAFKESCLGSADGLIEVFAESNYPIEYVATPTNPVGEAIVQTSNVFMYLSAGTYSIEVRSTVISECTGGIVSTDIPAGEPVEVQITGGDIVCQGQASVINAGTGYASYQWSNGSTAQATTILSGGEYSVTVVDTNSIGYGLNCFGFGSILITENPELFANTSAVDATHPGGTDGHAQANPSGGTPPYTYLWDNGSTEDIITELMPDEYIVRITDQVGCQVQETVTVGFTPFISRQHAISIFEKQIAPDHPFRDSLIGFLINNTGPDSVLSSGTIISPWDSSFVDTLTDYSYLFFTDNESEFEWFHSSSFVIMNAFDGSFQLKHANSWPVIDGIERSDLMSDGNDSPDKIKGKYADSGSPYNFTAVSTGNKNDWAIIIVGRNLDGAAEKTARKNDEARIKECLNNVTKGPRISKENIISATGTDYAGATIEEVCTALEGLKGKACDKLYFHYIGHGRKGSLLLKKKDKNITDPLKYDVLACKLIELGVPEVCVTIEACFSGSAIIPMSQKSIHKDGKALKLKGTILTSSSSTKKTIREPDGTPFIKSMNLCCKDDLADLNSDGKVSLTEAVTWASALNPLVASREPQGSTLGDKKEIVFGCKVDFKFNDKLAGRGNLLYEAATYSYQIVGGSSNGEDTIISKRFLYIRNPRKKDPYKGRRSVQIQCLKKIGSKRVWVPIKTYTPNLLPGQRKCIIQLPEDCLAIQIGLPDENLPPSHVQNSIQNSSGYGLNVNQVATYLPGEHLFYVLEVADTSNQIYFNTTDSINGWNLSIDPEMFTTHELIDSEMIILRGTVPDTALTGKRIEIISRNSTTPDTIHSNLDALIFDSLDVPIVGGELHRFRFLINSMPIALMSGKTQLFHSQLMFGSDASLSIAAGAKFELNESNVYPFPGVTYNIESMGMLTLNNSAINGPVSGLNLNGGAASIQNSAILNSGSDGVRFSGNFDSTSIFGLFVDASGKSGIVVDNVISLDIHDLIVTQSTTTDIHVLNHSYVRLIDSYFDTSKIIVDESSLVERVWTTQFEVITEDETRLVDYPFSIFDSFGNEVAVDTTDSNGLSSVHLLKQTTYSGASKIELQNHYLTFRFNGIDSTVHVIIDTTLVHEIILPRISTSTEEQVIITRPKAMNVFPNPARDELQVNFDPKIRGKGLVRISDIGGKIMFNQSIDLDKLGHVLYIDLTHIPPGVHWISWHQPNHREAVSFQVSK